MAAELGHKGLTEAHDLPIAFPLGIKIAPSLSAAHGEGGQGVLKDLLKPKKLNDGQVHAGVKAQAALVRTDGRIELDPVAAVHPDLAAVVHPRDPEHDHTLRLHHALNNAAALQLRPALHNRLQGFQDLADRLEKFRLVAAFFLQRLVYILQILTFPCHICQTPLSALQAESNSFRPHRRFKALHPPW